jgi:hypothetical protein
MMICYSSLNELRQGIKRCQALGRETKERFMPTPFTLRSQGDVKGKPQLESPLHEWAEAEKLQLLKWF